MKSLLNCYLNKSIIKTFSALSYRVNVTILLSLIIIGGCKKSKLETPEVSSTSIQSTTTMQTNSLVNYINTSESKYTLSSYVYNSSNNKDFIGKVFPASNKKSQYKISTQDAANFTIRNDSLFVLQPGKALLATNKYLDFTLLIDNNGFYKKEFKIVYDEFLKNRIIAHRGAYAKLNLPWNSIASLKQAIAIGCQASEFDVWLTLDKVVVVSHDPVVNGMNVETTTYADLVAKFKLSNGEKLPTLKEYLEEGMKQNKTRLELEIKPSLLSESRSYELTDSVVNLVHRIKAQAWVRYSSWGYGIPKRIAQTDVSASSEYINDTVDRLISISKLKADGVWGVNYKLDLFTNHMERLTEALGNNINVIVWSINDKNSMIKWLNTNVSAICTDDPDLLKTLVKN